ncbi:MAG: hypothetical protein JWP32_1589 [Schumannella sp.]|nr:hypothetical protein [Schumannella sp.]
MPETRPRAVRRGTARKFAGTAIAMAALAGGLLTAQSAAAVGPATSLKPSLTDFATWHQWVDPAGYDYGLTSLGGVPSLRMSNGISDPNLYGNITQLSSPAIAEAGEPVTGAAYRVFTADYTIDAASYLAQPGLAVEVSGDQSGNRSGGGVVFRQDADGELTLSTYWATAGSEADLADWNNSTATVPFAGPVKIRYVAEYNAAAPDSVKVYVNNVLKLTGQGFEAYHEAVGSDPQKIDSLLFRTSRNKPVAGGAWDVVEPDAGQRAALAGNGFYFSAVEYGVSNTALAPSTTLAVSASVTGTPIVGGSLTASADTNVISGATLGYQWLREGLPISGAPATASYLISANDLGKRISVKVTASKPGYTSGSGTSAKTAPVSAASLSFSSPATITGTAQLGSTLTGNGATTPAGTYTYQWYRDGAQIKGATAKTYKLAASDVGREMTVRVTAAKAGYATLSSTSAPTADVAPGTLVAGTVTLGGTFKVGSNIAATSTGWTSGTTLKYAFYADGELVQYGAARIFKLTWEEQGTSISVIVTGSKFGYDRLESAESAARGPVRA